MNTKAATERHVKSKVFSEFCLYEVYLNYQSWRMHETETSHGLKIP